MEALVMACRHPASTRFMTAINSSCPEPSGHLACHGSASMLALLTWPEFVLPSLCVLQREGSLRDNPTPSWLTRLEDGV